NGYSLIRKILEREQADLSQTLNGDDSGLSLGKALLAPTRIYVKTLLDLFKAVPVHALAHITGGGLPENLPRVLPEGCEAHISKSAWQRPAVFDWLQSAGNVPEADMLRTFNCGIGMVVVVAPEHKQAALASLKASGEQVWELGQIVAGGGQARVVVAP
ncbi:MAG: phosphoribosylformylglycinamidine cyclo-ligase, partial [Chromatiales bacterium]|nr:phosphoribosylformylglycinamidine cyclo-ligase [Chromatiales bacterium]